MMSYWQPPSNIYNGYLPVTAIYHWQLPSSRQMAFIMISHQQLLSGRTSIGLNTGQMPFKMIAHRQSSSNWVLTSIIIIYWQSSSNRLPAFRMITGYWH